MIGSHYSVRFVQTRKEEPRITFEEFRDVKWACHHWLMKNSPNYRREQQELPERKQMKKRNEDHNCLDVSDEEKD
jgi:hypothetical protein